MTFTGPPPAPRPMLPPVAQPARRRSWLVVLASLVLGLGAVAVAVLIVLGGGPEAALVGFVPAAVPVPLLVAVFLWLDRYEPEPWRYLLSASTRLPSSGSCTSGSCAAGRLGTPARGTTRSAGGWRCGGRTSYSLLRCPRHRRTPPARGALGHADRRPGDAVRTVPTR